jgi:hypothetical protein
LNGYFLISKRIWLDTYLLYANPRQMVAQLFNRRSLGHHRHDLPAYRVDNFAQYRALRTFRGDDEVELTLWRGVLFKATIAKKSLLGIELRTYPITGFVE